MTNILESRFVFSLLIATGFVIGDAMIEAPHSAGTAWAQGPNLASTAASQLNLGPTVEDWQRCKHNATLANQAFRQCRRYVAGWLQHADPKTGLLPRNLHKDKNLWNGKDCAADNYPFMVMTCALVDQPLYRGRMRRILETETRLTSRMGNLVDPYSFTKQAFHYDKPDLNRMIFESSEYVKDGLMPLTELLGPTPWTDRMIGMVDDILAHSSVTTPGGPIPSNNVEVNGEMMQVLGRLYWMTGDEAYLSMAMRIADYYLLGTHHPTRDLHRLSLRDHGCELISGLSEVYVTCHFARPDKANEYRESIHAMLDRILEVGINEDGFTFDRIDPVAGVVTKPSHAWNEEGLSDNWGYNYNAFYAIYLVDGVERYRQAVIKVLRSLNKPKYLKYPWQDWGADGIADSVEGAINLYNREPVEGVDRWIDANVLRMLEIQKPDGIIEGWYGDGNFARTAIMWALWKQQGVTVQPWREDVKLGAVRKNGNVVLLITAEKAWSGKLAFDRLRHKTIMEMPLDYPRINQLPEWFTVAEGKQYHVTVAGGCEIEKSGSELLSGFPLQLDGGKVVQMVVSQAP